MKQLEMMRISHSVLIFIILFGCASAKKNDKSTVIKVLEDIEGEPVVPRSANRIYIPPFKNSTGNYLISEKLMIRLNKLVSMDGRLATVPGLAIADLTLRVRILSYIIQKIEFGNYGRVIKKRMRITAAVELLDNRSSKIIFSKTGIQSFRSYSDLIPPIQTELEIQDIVLDNLANRIFSKTITGWDTEHMTNIEKGKR